MIYESIIENTYSNISTFYTKLDLFRQKPLQKNSTAAY